MKNLHQEYQKERNININEDLFYSMVFLYPPVLIAKADGIFDDTEKEYIANLSAALALEIFENEQEAESNAELVFNELLFLSSEGASLWHDKFINELKINLVEPEDKAKMLEMLTQTAEVSNGISIEERKMISEIKKSLNIN